jgi:proteasome accessory factor B
LESELKIPIWGDGSIRGIVDGYFLPPISFTLDEAHNIFGAVRLLQNFYPENVPIAALTFFKLNAIAPSFFKKHIGNILEHMEKQPQDNGLLTNYDKFRFAWTTQHKLKFFYKDKKDDEITIEHIVEPYFVDPSVIDKVIHIIGYSNVTKTISSFRFDHIIGDIIVEPDTFQMPDELNIIDYLDEAWGIRFDPEILVVKLLFKPRVSHFALKLYLHPSQKTEIQSDNSVIMTLRIRDTLNFRHWVIEWGNTVEVLEPQTLRNQIYDLGRSLANIYAP